MIPIAFYLAEENLFAAFRRSRSPGVVVPTRNLVPDQDADLIRRAQVIGRRDFDVRPKHIQAELFGLAHLVKEKFVRRGRVDAFGIKILIERGDDVYRLAVQVELAVASFEGAESEAAGIPIVSIGDFNVV